MADEPEEDDDSWLDNYGDHDLDFMLICDAIGVCEGCGETTLVNGYMLCEFCMDEFE